MDELEALARREGATLFMTLLAAFQALLARYGDQLDVVVGTPIANRVRRETEGLIGLFFNLLALRTRFHGRPSFRALLARVRETTLGAYGHQDLPFEKLLEALQPERQLSFTPFFQVTFVLQNVPFAPLELPQLELAPLAVDTGTAYFDLTLFVDTVAEGLLGTFEYRSALFDDTTLARFERHFRRLLAEALAQPDRPLVDLPLLEAAERCQLLAEWNDTERAFDTEATLSILFARQAAATPEAPAVEAWDAHLPYAELAARAKPGVSYLSAPNPDALDKKVRALAADVDRALDRELQARSRRIVREEPLWQALVSGRGPVTGCSAAAAAGKR